MNKYERLIALFDRSVGNWTDYHSFILNSLETGNKYNLHYLSSSNYSISKSNINGTTIYTNLSYVPIYSSDKTYEEWEREQKEGSDIHEEEIEIDQERIVIKENGQRYYEREDYFIVDPSGEFITSRTTDKEVDCFRLDVVLVDKDNLVTDQTKGEMKSRQIISFDGDIQVFTSIAYDKGLIKGIFNRIYTKVD